MQTKVVRVVIVFHHLLGGRMRAKERVFQLHLGSEIIAQRQVDIRASGESQLVIARIAVAIHLAERWAHDEARIEALGRGFGEAEEQNR